MSSAERTPAWARIRAVATSLGRADALLVIGLLVCVSIALAATPSWRMKHDLPMMMYQAFATSRFGLLPYRDFFDMNLPGTYTAYRFIGAVFGYDDRAIRIADWAWLTVLWGVSLSMMRGFPLRVPLAGLSVFTLVYLRLGAALTLQREFLVLPVLAFAVLATCAPWAIRWRGLAVGLAMGVAVTFKPHMVVGVLPLAAYLAWDAHLAAPSAPRVRVFGSALGWIGLGFGAPVALVAAWISWNGLWSEFLHSLGYLVYYGQLDGYHDVIEPSDRVPHLLRELLRMGGHGPLLCGAAFGAWVASSDDRLDPVLRRRITLLLGVVGAFFLYPAGSGQFWTYHWLPMTFFASLCFGLVLMPVRAPITALSWVLPRLMLVLYVGNVADLGSGMGAFWARQLRIASNGRPEDIAKFLGEHLQPGDTVQPFDWVAGGVVHGMLLAEARPATPYLYTFHFYHHVSTPYIRMLQEDFMSHLEADPPAFVVASNKLWPFVKGADTSKSFPRFDTWLDENYLPAHRGKQLVVWERADHLRARGGEVIESADEKGVALELSAGAGDMIRGLLGAHDGGTDSAPPPPPPQKGPFGPLGRDACESDDEDDEAAGEPE